MTGEGFAFFRWAVYRGLCNRQMPILWSLGVRLEWEGMNWRQSNGGGE